MDTLQTIINQLRIIINAKHLGRAYPSDGGSKVHFHCLNLDYTD